MEIYRDAITGYEVRRYANGPERNSKLYFTYHTTTQSRTFETETFEFDNQMIYSFYFVLYDHGKRGIFGVKTNLNDTMVALKTVEVEQ